MIEEEIRRAQHDCEPADGETLIAEMTLPLAQWRSAPGWNEGVAAVYYEGLRDLPADLLRIAMMRMIRLLNFFPRVAEIRNLVEDEWAARRQALALLQFARRQAMGGGSA